MTVVGSSDECYCVYHLVAGLAGYSRPYVLYYSNTRCVDVEKFDYKYS